MLSTPLEKKEKKPIEVTVYMFSDIFLVLSSYKAAKMRVELNLHYKCMKVADVDYGAGDGVTANRLNVIRVSAVLSLLIGYLFVIFS